MMVAACMQLSASLALFRKLVSLCIDLSSQLAARRLISHHQGAVLMKAHDHMSFSFLVRYRPLPEVFAEQWASMEPGNRGGIRVPGVTPHISLAADK